MRKEQCFLGAKTDCVVRPIRVENIAISSPGLHWTTADKFIDAPDQDKLEWRLIYPVVTGTPTRVNTEDVASFFRI